MKVRPLAELCDVTMGQAPEGSTYNSMGVGLPLIAGASDLGDRTPQPSRWTSSPTQTCATGDIILCIRATIGDRNWADREYCLGRGVAGLRAKAGKLDSAYLWHWLGLATADLVRAARGATFLQVSRHDIEDLAIPAPESISDQRRIAAVLDKADAIRSRRRDAIALTERLLHSLFLEMFGDPMTNPRGWDEVPLARLGLITTGNTPSRAVPEYFGDDIEWIKSDNINTPSHFLTRAVEGLSKEGRAQGRTAPAGSTLMTCIAGSPDCIGNVALADREVAFNQQINAITPHEGVDHRYLYVLLLVGKRIVQAASTNSMKGMVSKGRLEEVRVPSPPPRMQEKFGETFDRVLALGRRQETGWTESDRLFNAVLGNAFAQPLRADSTEDRRPT